MGWLRNMLASKRGYYSTPGGIHMEKHKEASHKAAIEELKAPALVTLPLRQHIGAPLTPTVKKKDQVKMGQVVAESPAFVSTPIHAPVSGTVKSIGNVMTPTGMVCEGIVIENDGNDEWIDLKPLDPEKADKKDIIERVKWAGLVGLGGAAFPSHVKLVPQQPCEYLIINGAECEPYLAKDFRLMLEHTEDLVLGVRLLERALNVKKTHFAIHADKMAVVDKLRQAFEPHGIIVTVLPVKYPHGAEKVLIDAVIGRRVPPKKLPFSVGAMVFNVETAITVARAVRDGKPLIQKYFTVAGEGFWHTKNVLARLGTPLIDAIEFSGGITQECKRIVFGGPMTGFAIIDTTTPVIKATGGLVGLTDYPAPFGPCIRCGKCVQTCDNGVNPSIVSVMIEQERFDAENVPDLCVECGACSYVCPEHRPLTQFSRIGKRLVEKYLREQQNK